MKEITELASQLSKMGIFNASLEVDIQRLQLYRSQVDEAFKESDIIYESKSRIGVTPGFTVQVYGVKMYFNDPKTYI